MRVILIGVLGLVVSVLVACSTTAPSRLNRDWGSAQRDNMATMIVNPAGSEPGHDPGAETDGVTAEHVIKALRAEQASRGARPSAPPVINIGTVGR
jgi:hypothetical protein